MVLYLRLLSWVLFLLFDFSFKFGFSSFALVANMVGLIIIAVFVRSENVHVMLWPIVQIFFCLYQFHKEGHSLFVFIEYLSVQRVSFCSVIKRVFKSGMNINILILIMWINMVNSDNWSKYKIINKWERSLIIFYIKF